ncbi:MAG: T9SS type A sorting domain-containing protein [Cryomorphaceae bacterium]|nr:T9SS type A sorting domain-containing protein [Cryomorphaceae bacterium]
MTYNYYTFILVALLYCSQGHAQRYVFSYDNAGNRIEREFLMLRSTASMGTNEIQTQINELELRMYPNPTSDWLYIDCQEIPDEIGVFDFNGRPIKTNMTKDETIGIDMSQQPAGTYLLRIRVGKQERTWKVIVL